MFLSFVFRIFFILVPFFVLVSSSTNNTNEITLLKERPQWLRACRRKDPNLNQCLKDGLQTMFPALSKGIPEIEVERFEPLFIKQIGVSKGHGAVSITGAMQDLLVHGPSNATTTYVSMDLENKRWQFGIEVPYLKLESKYNIKGNILLLPVVGTGDSIIHLKYNPSQRYVEANNVSNFWTRVLFWYGLVNIFQNSAYFFLNTLAYSHLNIPAIPDIKGDFKYQELSTSGDGKCLVTNKFEFQTIQGREILQITNMKVDFSVSGMRLHLSNLFNGNKVLGQTVNQFLNKNALQVVDELKEDIGDALSVVFVDILNNAFRHMPTDLWLLKD